MIRLAALTAMFFTAAMPATATDLFEAVGAWQGEGRIATGPRAPLEKGRCKVEVTPAPGGQDVSITGRCAVAAGLSDVSMRLVRGAGGKVNAGFWSAASGQTVQFSGTETAETIIMQATSALMVDEAAYESRVEVAVPGGDGFTIRQMVRGEGEEAWRLVLDMAYLPAGG